MLSWLYNWLQEFLKWLWSLVTDSLAWMLDQIKAVLEWVVYLGWEIWDEVFKALGSLLESFTRPAFYASAETAICNGLGGVTGILGGVDFMGPLALGLSGYALRFLIRRIPFIG